MEFDIGYVNGTTWHGLPQYITLDRPPTADEARKVMCFEIEKQQLYRMLPDQEDELNVDTEPVEAWCIVRKDTDSVLVDHVGARFVAQDNKFLFDYINENLLAEYPDLEIESVGTLWNGATVFLNLKVAEFQIRGDESKQISRMFFCNPLGRGAYKAGGHNVRIVCSNTLGFAAGQAAANKTLKKFQHTSTAAEKINGHLDTIAEFRMGLQRHVYELDALTSVKVNSQFLDQFLDAMFPIPVAKDEGSSRGVTIAKDKRAQVTANFESDQALDGKTGRSAYALLQATTNYIDNQSSIRGGDKGSRWIDSVDGNRAAQKVTAFDWLMTKV